MKKKIIAYKQCAGTFEVPVYSDPLLDKNGKILTFENMRSANTWIFHRLNIPIFYLFETRWHEENFPKDWPGDELY